MLPAYTYDKVCKTLSDAFQKRHHDQSNISVRMTGLLFARPTSPIARDEIVPNLDYFHHRSSDYIDFFCAGYGMYWENWFDKYPDQQPVSENKYNVDWLFSNIHFDKFRREIEKKSSWTYSGAVDLILLNALFSKSDKVVQLDFKSSIVCRLDLMKTEGAILSVETFFEDIIRYNENAKADNSTWEYSDKKAVKASGSALRRIVLSLLPKGIGDDVKMAMHFAISDIRPKEQ